MKIKLAELAAAMQKSDALQGYVDIQKGRVVLLDDDFDVNPKGKVHSDEDTLEHIFSIEDDWENYVPIPNIFDEVESDIKNSFVQSLKEEERAAFSGHGSFFRQIKTLHLTDLWEAHCKKSFLDIARDWCEENDIDFEE